jgi:hypothetical protein
MPNEEEARKYEGARPEDIHESLRDSRPRPGAAHARSARLAVAGDVTVAEGIDEPHTAGLITWPNAPPHSAPFSDASRWSAWLPSTSAVLMA